MTDTITSAERHMVLTADEVALLRAALRMLRNVLGRDEAEELAAVKALLARLDEPA